MWTLCGQNQVGSVSGFFRGSDQDTDPFLSRKPDQDQFHPDPQPFIQRLPFLSIMFHSLSRIRRINLVCACEANNKCPRKTENLICLNWLDCSRHSYSCWNQVDQFLIDKLIVVPKIQKVKSSLYLRSWFLLSTLTIYSYQMSMLLRKQNIYMDTLHMYYLENPFNYT